MGTETGSTAFDVAIGELSKSAKGISFFQLNQLFQRCVSLTDRFENVVIRFTAKNSLAFPASDIDAVTVIETLRYTEIQVNVTFMGLFGPSSPLPAFYTERLLHTDDESNASAQFLNIFNHHLISLLQSAWEKYRYFVRYEKNASDQLSNWIFNLIGIDDVESMESKGLDWSRLLPIASLMAAKVKNAITLKTLLEAYFDGIGFSIEECVERNVTIPTDQQQRMGASASTMGFDLVLGDEVVDRMGKFRVHIHRLDSSNYRRFLPASPDYHELKSLISTYMRDQLDYDICLHLDSGRCVTAGMGDETMSLGWNSCMGDSSIEPETTVVI